MKYSFGDIRERCVCPTFRLCYPEESLTENSLLLLNIQIHRTIPEYPWVSELLIPVQYLLTNGILLLVYRHAVLGRGSLSNMIVPFETLEVPLLRLVLLYQISYDLLNLEFRTILVATSSV